MTVGAMEKSAEEVECKIDFERIAEIRSTGPTPHEASNRASLMQDDVEMMKSSVDAEHDRLHEGSEHETT